MLGIEREQRKDYREAEDIYGDNQEDRQQWGRKSPERFPLSRSNGRRGHFFNFSGSPNKARNFGVTLN
jgi:hypothetical protein